MTLLEIQVSTLFRCDAFGRLMSLNEIASPVAPRFFLGRTQGGNLLRLRQDLLHLGQPPRGLLGLAAYLALRAR